jgi:hypothetical protein
MTWVEVVVVRVRRRVLGLAFVVLEGDMVQVTNKPLEIRMTLQSMKKVLRSRNLMRMAIRFLGQREPWRFKRNQVRNSTGCLRCIRTVMDSCDRPRTTILENDPTRLYLGR